MNKLIVDAMAEELEPEHILAHLDQDWHDHHALAWDAVEFYKDYSYDAYADAVRKAFGEEQSQCD